MRKTCSLLPEIQHWGICPVHRERERKHTLGNHTPHVYSSTSSTLHSRNGRVTPHQPAERKGSTPLLSNVCPDSYFILDRLTGEKGTGTPPPQSPKLSLATAASILSFSSSSLTGVLREDRAEETGRPPLPLPPPTTGKATCKAPNVSLISSNNKSIGQM